MYAPNAQRLVLLAGPLGRGNCTPTTTNFDSPITDADYNPTAKTWTLGNTPRTWNKLAAAEYDPVSGKIILLSNYGLHSYDPVARVAVQHQVQYDYEFMSYAENLVYYPPNGKMYYMISRANGPARVYEVTLDRADLSRSTVIELTGISNAPADLGEVGWAYDPANAIIGGGVKNGVFHAFDPITKAWTAQPMLRAPAAAGAVGTMAFHALAFDPVNGVFIFITDGASGRHTWAYRYAR